MGACDYALVDKLDQAIPVAGVDIEEYTIIKLYKYMINK